MMLAETGLSVDDYRLAAVVATTLPAIHSPDPLQAVRAIFNMTALAPEMTDEGRALYAKFLSANAQFVGQIRHAIHAAHGAPRISWTKWLDPAPFRSRPIVCASDGRAIALDPELLADRILLGPLFSVLQGKNTVDPNLLFGAFGNGIERYVLKKLAEIYPPSSTVMRKLVPNPQARRGTSENEFADALIVGAAKGAVIEVKAAFLREVDTRTDDPAVFEAALRKKYLRGQRPVGVGQLARNLRDYCEGAVALRDGTRLPKMLVPVLVSHDPLLSAPGTLDILRQAFAESLSEPADAERRVFPIAGFSIARPVVLTLRDLELLYGVSKKRALEEVLWEAAMSEEVSFHDYLVANQESLHPAESPWARDAAVAALDRARARYFGRSNAASSSQEPDFSAAADLPSGGLERDP